MINIYCDESCHLENDKQSFMVLGALWCEQDRVVEAVKRLREIRESHNIPKDREIKWVKVSPAKKDFYTDLIDYFFDDDDLKFRAIVIPKSSLKHKRFNQDHDTFYYKMQFQLLNRLLSSDKTYAIYLDIKDTRSAVKVRKLHDVLCNANFDFNRESIVRLQNVRSHEVGLIQLADLLIGAVLYANRTSNTTAIPISSAKQALVDRVRDRSGLKLTLSTPGGATKVNIFQWKPKESIGG
jgi:hypothetical protein